jgi:hypothetical protein
VQAAVPNQGGAMPFEQGTAVVAHLPAEALRVLADQAVARSEVPSAEAASR